MKQLLEMSVNIDIEKHNEFIKEQDKLSILKEKKEVDENHILYKNCSTCWEMGIPYTSTINNSFSYVFTDTPLGTIVEIRSNITGDTCIIADIPDW